MSAPPLFRFVDERRVSVVRDMAAVRQVIDADPVGTCMVASRVAEEPAAMIGFVVHGEDGRVAHRHGLHTSRPASPRDPGGSGAASSAEHSAPGWADRPLLTYSPWVYGHA